MRLVADVAEYCLLVVVALVVAILAIVLLVHVSSRSLACDDRFPHCTGVMQVVDVVPAKALRGRSVSLAGVVPPLAAKALAIKAACGARVVSGVRRTRIAGSRRISLHAYGRAVDLQGNPGCIYRQLAGWPGGVSTDYGRVRHVHVSYDPQGREWGRRFAHYRVGKRNIFRRYAMRRR